MGIVELQTCIISIFMNRYYLRKAIQKIWLEKRQFTNKAIRSFAISVEDNLEQILLLFGKPTTKIYKKD